MKTQSFHSAEGDYTVNSVGFQSNTLTLDLCVSMEMNVMMLCKGKGNDLKYVVVLVGWILL